MKKLKRADSIGINKESKKVLSTYKNNSSTNFKNKPKKLFKEAVEKQNILIEESQSKYAKIRTNTKKKVSEKKNKRSKSMIYEKKIMAKIDLTNDSSRFIDQIGNLNTQENKSPLHFYANVASVREIHQNEDTSSYVDYSPLVVKNKNDGFTQVPQILIQDASVQCSKFDTEDKQKREAQNKKTQKQKKDLESKIADLESQIAEVIRESNQKEKNTYNHHEQETKLLNHNILSLKQENLGLSKERSTLKNIVGNQQKQIKNYKKVQETLEARLKSEETAKEALTRVNEESKREIQFYKKELASFQDSLTDLQKMKSIYEKRLDKLEHEKVRIKSNACELLKMVEKYKQVDAEE